MNQLDILFLFSKRSRIYWASINYCVVLCHVKLKCRRYLGFAINKNTFNMNLQ